MPTIFTRIIDGELPGHFVWRDERAVAFLSINPLQPGHTLVVPLDEIDHWLDAPTDLNAHLMGVAQAVGAVLQAEYEPTRVALMIAGLEVPHLHLHVVPMRGVHDLDFANAAAHVDPDELAAHADRIRGGLRAADHGDVVPASPS
ncbi:MAG: HIT family protein [Actinomycetota bacterium]